MYLKKCEGGQTVFYPDRRLSSNASLIVENDQTIAPIVIEVEEGLALLHRHGEDCLLHEAREVISGEKLVIRADICIPI